jgi:hypothetical protein
MQRVELDPLPEGVPDELPIQCNGRSALLLVRTQKVLYNDHEISASKFEALCGKGDAKKWKSSIWQEDEDGDVVVVSHHLLFQDFGASHLSAAGKPPWPPTWEWTCGSWQKN